VNEKKDQHLLDECNSVVCMWRSTQHIRSADSSPRQVVQRCGCYRVPEESRSNSTCCDQCQWNVHVVWI